jgi:hypothetical protein
LICIEPVLLLLDEKIYGSGVGVKHSDSSPRRELNEGRLNDWESPEQLLSFACIAGS